MIDRPISLRVPLSDHENRMLEALTADCGLSKTDFVRQYIRRAFSERFAPEGAFRYAAKVAKR